MEDKSLSCSDLPIACNLTEASLAARRKEIVKEIFSECLEINELKDGYEFRFKGDDAWFNKLTEFVSFERKCCPFFTFNLSFEPNQSAIVLSMQGAEGTKEFIREELKAVRSAESGVRS